MIRLLAVLLFVFLVGAVGGPGSAFAAEPCDLSLYYRERSTRIPEYAYMSDAQFALMMAEKVDQAKKFGKARTKLVGLVSRHFPEYRGLSDDELVERMEVETRQALRCYGSEP